MTISQNFPYLTGLWSLESSNVYCHNHNRLIVANQKECQDKCEDDEECVGISYGYNEMKWELCYACKDDGLSKANRGYGFYRKPTEPGKNQKIEKNQMINRFKLI